MLSVLARMCYCSLGHICYFDLKDEPSGAMYPLILKEFNFI